MPAALPGSTTAENQANPSAGRFVILDPLSGPMGSPLDARRPVYDATDSITPYVNDPLNISTGCLSTGIGISAENIINVRPPQLTSPEAIFRAGYNDNMVPGEKVTVYAAPPPPGVVTTDIVDSTMMYIGGGRDVVTLDVSVPTPYTVGVAICGAGNGASRDGGIGPAIFTGFPMKMVTAIGAVANGVAIEAGFINRSGKGMVATESAFGSDIVELATAA